MKIKLHYPEGMKLHGDNACKYHNFERYNWEKDRGCPAMFWLYTDDDYLKLANHTGKKYVCWHNADVMSFANNFAGKYVNIVRNPEITHVCLNHITQGELASMGIHAVLRYIFWADPSKYTPQNEFTEDIYMCSAVGRGAEYGEHIFNTLAWQFPEWQFHIFGIDPVVQVYCDNVKYYGWISEDEMDEITKNFALCIRYNRHDGFPQVMCKALLRRQKVITTIPYDGLTIVAASYNDLVLSVKAAMNEPVNDLPSDKWIPGQTIYLKNGIGLIHSMINNWDFLEQ